jgi:hypothetical protein
MLGGRCVVTLNVTNLCSKPPLQVGIATGYGLEARSSIPDRNKKICLLYIVQNGYGAHLAIYPVGIGAFSLGIKGLRREANYSPPPSTEVKNAGAIPPLPHISS